MRRLLLVAIACDSGKPSPPPAPPPLVQPIADAPPPVDAASPDADPLARLHGVQARLGEKARSCDGAAEILAAQIDRRAEIPKLLKLCKEDRWNSDMLECVATADHDPFSCSQHLKGKPNKRFNDWMASYE
jgi:hypothetical protein